MIVGMQDRDQHTRLQHDLMAHRWQTWFAANHDDDDSYDGDGDDGSNNESVHDDDEGMEF